MTDFPYNSDPVASSCEPRVLIVDDEPAVQFAYRRLLEREGIAVDAAATCQEAIRLIGRGPYLAVLADRRLADCGSCSDCAVLTAIRSAPVDTILILADERDGRPAPEVANVHIFEKPVQPADVMDLVRGLA